MSKEDNYIEFSSVTKKGREDVLDLIDILITDPEDLVEDELIEDEDETI